MEGNKDFSGLRLIVGLGNPGKDYEYTRHNAGFLIIKHIAEQHHLKITLSPECKGLVAQGRIFQQECCLFFPGTFMNNSGVPVKQIIAGKNIGLDDVLVVCDDMNLDFGRLRLRARGSDSGHNGLSSVIYHLGSQDFPRLRMGIGSAKNKKDAVDFVLEEFNKKEKKQLPALIAEASDCCMMWLTQDIGEAMNQFNKRKENG